jgi:hypothetical protein
MPTFPFLIFGFYAEITTTAAAKQQRQRQPQPRLVVVDLS